jgi:tellurite resistance protein
MPVTVVPASDRSGRQVRRIPPNFFTIALGLAGLADAWHAARGLLGVPAQVADALNALAAAILLALVIAYLAQGWRQVRADAGDAVLSAFLPVAVITPLILATVLVPVSFEAARVLVVIFLALTIVIGGWITGQWIIGATDEDCAHPGYFLPTVAGGFIGAYAAAAVHLHALAEASFGIGILCWILITSTILTRLFFLPMLAAGLVPTLAILLAPPVVAGFAYAEMTHGRIDFIARALGGYAILMALVQLRFIPIYARLKFSAGFWAFTFPYAAAVTDALLWVKATRPPSANVYAIAALTLITILVAGIAVRTLVAVRRGELFPKPAGA